MFRVITPDYAAHWKVIGALLGLSTTYLDETETANPTNLQWCCNEMLKIWLARNTNATWKDILTAINSSTVTQGVPSSVAIQQSGPLNGVCMFFCFYISDSGNMGTSDLLDVYVYAQAQGPQA